MKKIFESIEMIHVQNNAKFKEEFSEVCNEVLNSYRVYSDNNYNNIYLQRFNNSLTTLKNSLKEKFNFKNLEIFDNDNYGPGATYYNKFFNILTPTINSYMDTGEKNLKDERELGGIDLKNSRLFGELANIPVEIYLGNEDLLNLNTNGPQLAAVIMHEVGHFFNYIEYSTKLYMVNKHISSLENPELIQKNPDIIKLALVNSIETLTGETVNSKDTLPVLGIEFYKELSRFAKNFIVTNYSDQLEEFLADTFATKMGYGVELAQILHSFIKVYGDDYVRYISKGNILLEVNGTAMFSAFTTTILKMILLLFKLIGIGINVGIFGVSILLIGNAVSSIAITPLLALLGIIAGAYLIYYSISNISAIVKDGFKYNYNYDFVHPSTGIRITNIRKELINELKLYTRPSSIKIIQSLINDIDLLETSMNEIMNNKLIKDNEKLIERITSNYKEFNEVELEKLLESMINNELYVDGAKLRLLGEK